MNDKLGRIDPRTFLRTARRAAGPTQAELARRSGTSQGTLSTYERGLQSPSLKVTARILAAADMDLAFGPHVDFEGLEAPGVEPFWVPNRLWRIHGAASFEMIEIPHLTRDSEPAVWNLRDREQRRSAYEILIQRVLPQVLLARVDGALLVDLWDELALPDVIRNAWAPAYADATETKRIDILTVTPAAYAAALQGDPAARPGSYRLLPRTPKKPEKYITVTEAADLLGIHVSMLSRLITDGTFPAEEAPGHHLINLKDVHKFQRTLQDRAHGRPRLD